MSSSIQHPPPPYAPPNPYPSRPESRNLAHLPFPILFKIISYTLDPKVTPNRWISDLDEEKIRRVWSLYTCIRGTCRSFWLVSMSTLRTKYHPIYLSLIQKGYSSDAYPHDSHPSYFDIPSNPSNTDIKTSSGSGGSAESSSEGNGSVFSRRSRETAVFDRWIAIRVGGELRKVESELSEDSGAEREIFARFQPSARMEDILLTYISSSLIIPYHISNSPPTTTFPLPHNHLSISLTPSWCQLYIWARPFGQGGNGKDLVLEVRRAETLEGSMRNIEEGLVDIGRGLVQWGGRVL